MYRTKGGRRELPALHYAAEVGDEAEVYRILMGWSVESSTSKHMRDVGENDKQRGMNPLHYAAKRGDEGIVLLILSYQKARFKFYSRTWQKGKRPPKNVPEATPPAKPEDPFKSLLASKSNGHGMDALHYAAACGHDGVANILLKYGADIKAECIWAGKNSMHYAAALGHVNVLSRLKSYLDSQEGTTDKPNPSRRNGGGKRELVQTTHGQISPSPTLEENSANSVPDTQQDGWSIVRSKKGSGGRRSKLNVEDNLERKATFKEMLETKSRRNGMTPLHFAASKGRDTAAKFLIECGASIEARCASGGMEPIHYAAKHGCFTTTRLLYRHNANINVISGKKGMAPLHYAAQMGHKTVVKFLCENNADSTAGCRRRQRTPLHYAAMHGHEVVVRMLVLYHPPSAPLKDDLDKTAAQYAEEEGSESMKRFLRCCYTG